MAEKFKEQAIIIRQEEIADDIYSMCCNLVSVQPHTVNIICDFFLTDDDRCLFKFFCHLCTSSLFHSLNYFTFLLQMFASVALNMVCSYASAS